MPLSEYQESVELAIWLDRRKILYTHVPNGGFRDKREAANFRRMGVKPGVPDYLIFTPPPIIHIGHYRGVALEMKSTAKYAKTSPLQREWLRRLGRAGWIAITCIGHEAAIERLTELGLDQVFDPLS